MSPEAEHRPSLEEIESSLEGSSRWLNEWYLRLVKVHNLTANLLKKEGASIELNIGDKKLGLLYKGNVQNDTQSNFGVASILQLAQVGVYDTDQPVMGRIFYKNRDFSNFIAVSFGWRKNTSDILYEMIYAPNKKIETIVRVTKPNILFTYDKKLDQQLFLSFYLRKNRLAGWEGEIGFDQMRASFLFKNGVLVKKDDAVHDLPERFNPIPHIQSFMRHRSKEPLLPQVLQ